MMATTPTSSSAASNTSMMKELLRKQLKYWVENFRDDMLPRDFSAKSFSRCTITLHKLELKMHKVGALLQLPAPLLVTRTFCSEVVIKVPSWTAADKFVQEPLQLHVVDLFVDIKSALDCDEAYRNAYDARAQAAVMDPDPLGSIASWYAFATILRERVELVVDNVYIKVFAHGVSRLRIELTNVHSRTTNAMWQDMRDLTHCVDDSPDGLLQTRFKFVSCSVSVLLTLSADGRDAQQPKTPPPPLQLVRDHAVTMRMTLFGHRRAQHASWETLSQVIDVDLRALAFDYDAAELLHIYAVYAMVRGWLRDATALEHTDVVAGTGAGLRQLMQQHKVQRTPSAYEKDATSNMEASFALQLTIRFTAATATLRFDSERLGKQHVVLAVQHAAINVIVHHDSAQELHVTIQDIAVRFQDRIVLFLKPDRDVMQLKQLRDSVFVKWHLHTLMCCVDGDLALALNEVYHAHSEKTQSAFIKCGTCLQQVRLESIETHVCSTPTVVAAVQSPTAKRSVAQTDSAANESRNETKRTSDATNSATPRRLRLVLAIDELDVQVDSHLFHTVQQLMRMSSHGSTSAASARRTFTIHLDALSVTTESKEFVGNAIFVPVLPLAFQMLECTLQGCGCVRKPSVIAAAAAAAASNNDASRDTTAQAHLSWWPERIFIELAQIKCVATHCCDSQHEPSAVLSPLESSSSAIESFVNADSLSLRVSFSDGVRICANCHPQLSAHASVDRVRCQLDDAALRFLQQAYRDAASARERSTDSITAPTLLFAVLELRTVELTILDAAATARLKSLFKHVSIVVDNQLGHLAVQSSLDFRSLFHSHAVRFAHRQTPALSILQVEQTRSSDSKQHVDDGDTTQYDNASGGMFTKHQRRRIAREQLRQRHARVIQRFVRRALRHRRQLAVETAADHCDSDTSDQHSSSSIAAIDVATDDSNDAYLGTEPSLATAPVRKSSSASATSLFGVPEDLVNANKRVVAAASAITNFVKSKHQQLENEVTGLATQSKESAARLVLPRYSAYKKILGIGSNGTTPGGAATATTEKTDSNGVQLQSRASATSKREEVRSADAQSIDTSQRNENERFDSVDMSEPGAGEQSRGNVTLVALSREEREQFNRLDSTSRESSRQSISMRRLAHGADNDVNEVSAEDVEENDNDASSNDSSNDDDGADSSTQQTDEDELDAATDAVPDSELDDGDATQTSLLQAHEDGVVQDVFESEHGLNDALLDSLPSLVRVLVQVREHRLRVPINPRERVGFLCREVVRRFNELFATQRSESITHVVLQDARGGVFALTDAVGFVYANESSVLFALPQGTSERVRCVARIEPVDTPMADASVETSDLRSSRRKATKTTTTCKALGSRFTRCSQLPLPLAIALLANESERDLLRCVLRAGTYGGAGGGHADEWPEMALNVSFLDPSHMLPVEVCWFGTCLEVTNTDAFVLCLQQLGLCTARASSKYVGKIMRDRLKIDAKNAFIRAACLRSGGDFAVPDVNRNSSDNNTMTSSNDRVVHADAATQGAAAVSYECLKEIVQDDYGVYMMPPSN